MEHVEVAVVGGGPAGATAGAAAAQEGAQTVVLEQGVPRTDREELGPDSTDAAGFLDYWLRIAGIKRSEIPEEVILRELSGARFVGPSESVELLRGTESDRSVSRFGFTFDRTRFDEWLRNRATRAGADYRVGTSVRRVAARTDGAHRLLLTDGHEIAAERLVLADGPSRRVTIPTLTQLLPDDHDVSTVIGPRSANHIAYQEHREIPPECYDSSILTFWWGWIPGHTAYPWLFPNDGRVARVGLTMPLNLRFTDVNHPGEFRLLRKSDTSIPNGSVYIERLLETAFPGYELSDFPLVTSRGKHNGTATYPISSTAPIDSPVGADIAVAGGAMGATSAFHEGGDHVAIRTGRIAGRLAGRNSLSRYNTEWKRAIESEVIRSLALAKTVKGYTPNDWDRAFRVLNRLLGEHSAIRPTWGTILSWARAARVTGTVLGAQYLWHSHRLRSGNFVPLSEGEYVYG